MERPYGGGGGGGAKHLLLQGAAPVIGLDLWYKASCGIKYVPCKVFMLVLVALLAEFAFAYLPFTCYLSVYCKYLVSINYTATKMEANSTYHKYH